MKSTQNEASPPSEKAALSLLTPSQTEEEQVQNLLRVLRKNGVEVNPGAQKTPA